MRVPCRPCAACHLLFRLTQRLACAEQSANLHLIACVIAASRCLPPAHLFGSYCALPALSRLLALLHVSCRPCAACHRLPRLTQCLACAEPSSNLHRVCHASMSCMPPVLSRLMPHLACAEPSSKPYHWCHGGLTLLATYSCGSYRASPALSRLLTFIACVMQAMRCMPPAL